MSSVIKGQIIQHEARSPKPNTENQCERIQISSIEKQHSEDPLLRRSLELRFGADRGRPLCGWSCCFLICRQVKQPHLNLAITH